MNNNQNENLSPDEIIEKLKEKLARDKEDLDVLVNASEDKTEENDALKTAIENALADASKDSDDAVVLDEIEEVDEIDEIDEIEEINEADEIVEADELEEVDEIEEADEVDEVEEIEETVLREDTAVTENDTPVIDSIDVDDICDDITSEDEEYIDMRIKEILDDIEDEGVENDSDVDNCATVMFDVPSDAISLNQEITEESSVSKPTVYHFKKWVPEAEQEKTTVFDSLAEDAISDDDQEKTKVMDIPELEKPDLNVMQTFGASVEHVRELYGDEVADEYEHKLANSDLNERQSVEYEYKSPEQKAEVFRSFKTKMIRSKGKILICTILTALILLLENLGIFGVKLGGMFNMQAYPVSNIMIDLQLLLICAFLAFPILKEGFMDLVSFEPSHKSATLSIVSVAILFDIISCFISGDVILYNFCAALAILFSLIYDVIVLKRDYMAFKILSSERTKSAAVVSIGTSKTPEVEAYEQIDENEEVKIVTVEKSKFVKDFFARTTQTDSSAQDKIVLPVAFASMVIVFILSIALNKNASYAFKISNMAFSVLLPFAVYLSYCFPISKASKTLYENNSAIVGSAAIKEYSGTSIISLEDRDIFPSYCVKLRSVKVYGKSRIDEVLYNASSVFSKLGGPLSDVFSLSTIEIGCSENVEIVCAEDDGIEALVDSNRILVGSPAFLSKYQIYAKKDENDTEDYCRMYLAVGDILCAKFYIKYSLDVDFENMMSRVKSCGICTVLKTFDPNIDDKMLSKFVDTSKFPIRVVKCKIGDSLGEVKDEIDSGIISTGNTKNTVEAAVICENLYNIHSSSNSVKVIAMAVGVLLSVLVAIFNIAPLCSLYVALYQLLWAIPAIVSGKISL